MIDPKTVYPKELVDELLRLKRLDPDWLEWRVLEDGSGYSARPKHRTWVSSIWRDGADAFGMLALSHWFADGPKVYTPSLGQCEALEQVELRIDLEHYRQPYRAIMVELPPGRYGPFVNALCAHHDGMVTILVSSGDHEHDICTTVGSPDCPMEDSINKYSDDCAGMRDEAVPALRVALNSCLALAHFGCEKRRALQKQVESDRRLAAEDSDRGRRARVRLKTAVQVLSFTQTVDFRQRDEAGASGEAGHSGHEVSPHWRKGHWAMVPCGVGRAERRLTFRRPCMVRKDLFAGQASDTVATYRDPAERGGAK